MSEWCWEEDFLGDDATLTRDGEVVAKVTPHGRLWQGVQFGDGHYIGDFIVATRETKAECQMATITFLLKEEQST